MFQDDLNYIRESNEVLFESLKRQNPQAFDELNLNNNKLSYKDKTLDLEYIRLEELPFRAYSLDADNFFELLSLINNVRKNQNEEFNNINYLNEILKKEMLNEEEKNFVNKFMDQYLLLQKYQNCLAKYEEQILSNYRQIVFYILYLVDSNNLTEGQKIIGNRSYENEQGKGRSNSMVRVLKDPNAPSILPEENPEDFYISKAGYVSILLITYSIINVGIILAISLLNH